MYLAGCGLFVGVFWVGGVLLILRGFGGLCAGFLGFGVWFDFGEFGGFIRLGVWACVFVLVMFVVCAVSVLFVVF